MSYRIVDVHAHAFPALVEEKAVKFLEKYYAFKIPNSGRIEDLLKSAQACQVEKLVVHATATHPSQVQNVNNWLASLDDPHLIKFGTLHPGYKNWKQELKRMKELGLKGLKLHPEFQGFDVDDPRMIPIYEEIGDELPILFHTGDEKLRRSCPQKMAWILDHFPYLRIIAAHLGGYRMWDESRKYLVGRNVYFDTSSAIRWMSPEQAADLIRKHGAEKVLFGTDYPIISHQKELEAFLRIPLTEEEREQILWKNFYRFMDVAV